MVNKRSATFDDADAIWRILEPVLRADCLRHCDRLRLVRQLAPNPRRRKTRQTNRQRDIAKG